MNSAKYWVVHKSATGNLTIDHLTAETVLARINPDAHRTDTNYYQTHNFIGSPPYLALGSDPWVLIIKGDAVSPLEGKSVVGYRLPE